MRRVYMAPIFVTAAVVLCSAIGAAGFATGLRARAELVRSQGEAFELGLPAMPIDADEAGSPRVADPETVVSAGAPRASEAPRDAALRYGVVELLPAGLTQWPTSQSALLRATLEAATAAAVEPPS
jgi:hypothetical protein